MLSVPCTTLDVTGCKYSRFLLRCDQTYVLQNVICRSVHRPSCGACGAAVACKWKGAVFVHWMLIALLYSAVTQSLLPLGMGFEFACRELRGASRK